MTDLAPELVTDRAGVARIFACSLNNVNKLRSKGMPRMAHGRYSIPDVVQWRLEQLTNRAALDVDELPQAVEARTKLIDAQTTYKRLEIRRMEAELVDADDVQEQMLMLVQLLVTALEGLPARAGQELAKSQTTAEAVAIMREHCHDARIELERELGALAGDVAPGGTPGEAAAPSNGGAVGGLGTDRAAGITAPGPVAL